MIKKISKNRQRRFLEYWITGIETTYTPAEITLFTKIETRCDPILNDLNSIEKQEVFKKLFDNELLANTNAFGCYLLLSYQKGTQKRLSAILKGIDWGIEMYSSINANGAKWQEFVPLCIGLSAKYQEIISASFTHDLEIINIKY